MESRYVLHYAPDNASLIIRLALLELGEPFDTRLVDRRAKAQRSPAYRALNPAGLIPVLETPEGSIFETAAILLWLAERHKAMAPHPNDPDWTRFIKWLFFASNTLHADLRMMFYPQKYIGADPDHQSALRTTLRDRLQTHLSLIDAADTTIGGDVPTVLDCYLVAILRWMALYPADYDRSWFDLTRYPRLHALCAKMETRPSARATAEAEGLGPHPFTAPVPATPPEGSAI